MTDNAQAIFSFNTTNSAAPALVNMLNSTNTTSVYQQQLGQRGTNPCKPVNDIRCSALLLGDHATADLINKSHNWLFKQSLKCPCIAMEKLLV